MSHSDSDIVPMTRRALSQFEGVVVDPSMAALVRFHSANKLLLLAHSQAGMRTLGRIVANHDAKSIASVLADYKTQLERTLAQPARYTSHINVMMHAMGYFSTQLSASERGDFLALLERYRAGDVPLSTAISICRAWIARFGNDYLAMQTYFARGDL